MMVAIPADVLPQQWGQVTMLKSDQQAWWFSCLLTATLGVRNKGSLLPLA
jgi:hypothetical protein